MHRRLIMMLLFGAGFGLLAAGTAAHAQDSQINRYVWYVKRSGTHITTGQSLSSTLGPYNSLAAAQAVKQQLDSTAGQVQGTTAWGEATIVRKLNPRMFQARPAKINPTLRRHWLRQQGSRDGASKSSRDRKSKRDWLRRRR